MRAETRITVPAALLVIVSMFLGCAHQASIPNTDRFPPHLKSVTSLNKTQLALNFDEELDEGILLPATFKISSTGDDARIKFIYKDPTNAKSVILITSPLFANGYQVQGFVADRNGNAGSVNAKFKPSSRIDTIPPVVTVSPASSLISFPYTIAFQFNEPVDTSKPITVATIPIVPSETVSASWKKAFTVYQIEFNDSSLIDQPFYTVLLPGTYDYTGNKTTTGTWGVFYSDTSLTIDRLFGSVISSQGQPAARALIVMKSNGIVYGGTQSDDQGLWQTECVIKDSTIVEAYYDSDQDAGFDEKASMELEGIIEDTVRLRTTPLASPLSTDQILSPSIK